MTADELHTLAGGTREEAISAEVMAWDVRPMPQGWTPAMLNGRQITEDKHGDPVLWPSWIPCIPRWARVPKARPRKVDPLL